MQKHQVRSVIGGKGCVKLEKISATKLEWIAVQLRALLPVPFEDEHPRLYYHISRAYMIAYQSAAETYELETVKKALKYDIQE